MNKQHLRPCIGGWLLIAGGALPIVRTLITLVFNLVIRGMPIRYMTNILGYSFLPNIIYALPLVVLGMVLVMKQQGISVAICCGCGVLVELVYPLLSNLLARLFGLAFIGVTRFTFLSILNALVFVLLALVALTAASPKNPLKKLWWIPAAIAGLAEIFSLIRSISMLIQNFHVRNLMNTMLTFLFGLVAVAGFFFAGQWLADPLRKKPIYRPAPQVPQGNYYQQPQYQQPVQPQPAATNSVVQELERAKALLDNGAITQEEYDALKKRLLN